MPVATFDVRTLSAMGSREIDFREEDGEVDTAYVFDGLDSSDPDGTIGDSTDIEVWNWTFSDGTFGDRPQVTHTFTTPGVHTVTLVVTDKAGAESFARTMTVRIANPLPIIQVRILDGTSEANSSPPPRSSLKAPSPMDGRTPSTKTERS